MRRAPLVLVATSIAAFTATLDNTVVAVALREVQRDLGSGVTGLQGVVTAYTVALAALLLAGGALVDVLGAKRVLLAGLLVFAGASVGCALSGSVTHLVAWRAVQGVGASLVLPGGLSVLAGAYPDAARRRRAIGIWAATGGTALVAGPVAGGFLVQRYGWESVFWVNVPLCLLVALVVLPAPSSPASHRRRLDLPGAVLTCVVLGVATYGVVLAGRNGWTAAVGLCAAGSVAAAALLVVVERRSADPLLPGPLLRDRHFTGGALGAFAASLAVFVLLVFVSIFLQLIQEHDAQQAGLLLLPLPLALVLTAFLAGRWHAVAPPVLIGLAVAGGGLVLLGFRLREGLPATELRLLLALVGAGVGLTTAPVVSASLASAGSERAGLAAASINVARELGGVVAVAGLGALAVGRLTSSLTGTLTDGGVPAGDQPPVLDALLGARNSEARELLLDRIGVEPTLRLNQVLKDAARDSFIDSTQLILVAGGVGLVLIGLACGRLLRKP